MVHWGWQDYISKLNETKLDYNDVTMSAIASQITSLTIVYSIVHSGADQRKHQSPASLVFVRGIHRLPVNSPQKEPVTRKFFSIWWRYHDTRQTPTIGKLRVRMIITNITIATNSNLYNHNKTTRRQCTLWEKLCGLFRYKSNYVQNMSHRFHAIFLSVEANMKPSSPKS